MAEATLRSGNPPTVDHVAAADIAAGEVVVLGNTAGLTCGIAQVPIANAKLGALATGGEWDVIAAGNYAAWSKVYWVDADNKVSTTSTNNAQFGYLVDRYGASVNTTNAVVRCLHHPFG
jgi:hypothetical protein